MTLVILREHWNSWWMFIPHMFYIYIYMYWSILIGSSIKLSVNLRFLSTWTFQAAVKSGESLKLMGRSPKIMKASLKIKGILWYIYIYYRTTLLATWRGQTGFSMIFPPLQLLPTQWGTDGCHGSWATTASAVEQRLRRGKDGVNEAPKKSVETPVMWVKPCHKPPPKSPFL